MNKKKEHNFSFKTPHLFNDDRGLLYEALRFKTEKIPNDGQIYVYTVTPKSRRGDHYHKNKEEWFFCVYGELELIIKTKDNKKIKKKLHYKNPEIVYVAPGTVHTLINNKNKEAVVVAYASKEFEKDNPDTYQVEGI